MIIVKKAFRNKTSLLFSDYIKPARNHTPSRREKNEIFFRIHSLSSFKAIIMLKQRILLILLCPLWISDKKCQAIWRDNQDNFFHLFALTIRDEIRNNTGLGSVEFKHFLWEGFLQLRTGGDYGIPGIHLYFWINKHKIRNLTEETFRWSLWKYLPMYSVLKRLEGWKGSRGGGLIPKSVVPKHLVQTSRADRDTTINFFVQEIRIAILLFSRKYRASHFNPNANFCSEIWK